MPENNNPKERILKVEEVGDHWLKRTFPLIRLKGKWLAEAGIPANSYVKITNPQAGMLVFHVVEPTP
jgi:hypothetical protein